MNKKKFARLEKIFSHINFSLSQKQRYEQKPLSFRSALHFCSAPKSLQIFSRVSFPASKFTPKIDLKKGLLQYSSSSRNKNREKTNTPLRVVKNQEHRNIATLSLQLRSYNQQSDKINRISRENPRCYYNFNSQVSKNRHYPLSSLFLHLDSLVGCSPWTGERHIQMKPLLDQTVDPQIVCSAVHLPSAYH